MPCYHPLMGAFTGECTSNGKRKYKIIGPYDPNFTPSGVLDKILIPCGQCIGCRLDYARKWADRMMLELETSKKAIFVTLTYNDMNLRYGEYDDNLCPVEESATLDKKDVQDWMKRLRARKEFEGVRISFFLSGEYGPSTHRPHYHAILFGIGLHDVLPLDSTGRISESAKHGKNDLGQQYYISSLLSTTWNHGFVLVSDVSYNTCAYVARYVTKKLKGVDSKIYAYKNIVPPFSLMSRRPGLGKTYLMEHPDCLDLVNIPVNDGTKEYKISIPRYYINQMNKEGTEVNPNPLYNPDRYNELVEQRKALAEDSMLQELNKHKGMEYQELLLQKENKRKNAISGKGKKKFALDSRNKI